MSPAQVIPHRSWAVVLILAATAWQVAAALAPTAWIGAYLTVDDTYLALQVARRWTECGFPTFDGIHRTSGFQPLWGLALLAPASWLSDPIALLRATLLMAAILNVSTGVLLYVFLRRVRPDEPALRLAALALWLAYCVSGRPALIGLENSLAPALLLASLLALLAFREQPGSAMRGAGLGLVLAGVVWTRLDAAIFALLLLAVAGVFAARSRRWQGLALAAGAMSLSACGYVAFELWAAGTPTPISGSVKRVIAERSATPPTVIGSLAAVGDAGRLVLKHAVFGVGLGAPPAGATVARVLLLGLICVALLRIRTATVGWLALGITATFAHALLIRLWLSAYFADALWYYSATNVLGAIGVPLLLWELMGSERARRGIAIAAAGVFVGRLASSCLLLFTGPPSESLAATRQAAAAWMSENIPATARVAAWNAGELAFFSGRTVVNLDGLVNDRDYLREIVRGQGSIDEYLKREGVDWVIDYDAGCDDAPGQYWATLPVEQWSVMATFGTNPSARQRIVRRNGGGAAAAGE